MMKITSKSTITFLLALALSLPCVAAEIEYEIRVGASRSDNIARTDMAEIEETVALFGLELNLQHESRRLEASVVTDLEYRNYTDDTFDNEVVGSLNADLVFQIAPDILSWVIRDQFGNLQTNPFEANTPANRQNINRFSTGPDLIIRMGSVTRVELGGRYFINKYEVSDIDSDVLSGRLSLVRALSPRRSLSLNVTADRIEFDNTTLNSNYDRQGAYIGFHSEISRGSLAINLGYNEIHDDGEVFDGNLINVEWTRELSASTTFKLAYDEGLTDASDSLDQNQEAGGGFGDVQRTPGVSDPFENKRFSAGIDFSRDSNSFFISAMYNKDEYVTLSGLDRDWSELRVGVSRVLGSAWRFRLEGGIRKTEFVVSGREDDDTILRAGLSRQLSRTIAINLDFTRFDRDSSESGTNYVENVASLTFSFSR